jgi:hypothetical protein
MKKLILAIVLAVTAVMGHAQVRPQSYELKFKDSGVAVTYINDGVEGAAAIVFKDLGFKDVAGIKGLNLSSVFVNSKHEETKNYFGALLNYNAVDRDALKLNFGVGVKGLDVTSLFNSGNASGFNFNSSRQVIWSVGLSIPFRT